MSALPAIKLCGVVLLQEAAHDCDTLLDYFRTVVPLFFGLWLLSMFPKVYCHDRSCRCHMTEPSGTFCEEPARLVVNDGGVQVIQHEVFLRAAVDTLQLLLGCDTKCTEPIAPIFLFGPENRQHGVCKGVVDNGDQPLRFPGMQSAGA